jgi:putative flippase GtrA
VLIQAVIFGAVGAINTSIDFMVYLLLTRGLEFPPVVAHALSFLVGSINSYVMNGMITFRSHSGTLLSVRRLFRFACGVGGALLLSTTLMLILVSRMSDLTAKVASTLATFVFSFLINRFLVFVSTAQNDRR